MGITRTPVSRVSPVRRSGEVIVRSLKGSPTNADQDEGIQLVQRGEVSQQIADPFKTQALYSVSDAGDFRIQTPPVNLAVLMRMPNDNSILRQCIEAMVINTEGHGHRLEYIGPEGEEKSDAALVEKEAIEDFLDSLHPELSLTEIRKRVRWDIETMGFGFIEVIRDKTGLPTGISHVPAHTMRVTNVDMELVEVPVEGKRFGKPAAKTKRRFRRYVQLIGTEKVWFKEYGDPRLIDPRTGKAPDAKNGPMSHEDSATEIVMLKQYVPGQLYGTPRWLNNLVAIQGSRQAELTNLDYFKENAIPALAVLVSGGFLHDETMRAIEEHVTAARGRAAQNRVLVLEVQGDEKAASKDGAIPQPRVDVKPLAGERPQDGMFLAYDKAQTDKVRSSFRLPPIFTGHAQDYSHASAKSSYEVAEGQVFGPERGTQDEFVNRSLLRPYGVQFWEVRSNPPRISDPEEIIKAVEAFEAVGALTPNVAIGLANEQFGLDIEEISEDWGNFPFAIIKDLAARGVLKGFETLLDQTKVFDKPVEEDDDTDPNGEPTSTDPNAANDDGSGEGGDQSAVASKMIRRAMGDLRDILDAANQARYQPRQRKAPTQKKAA